MKSLVHRSVRPVLLAVVLLVLTALVLATAAPARAADDPPIGAPPSGGPYLGAVLDWAADSAAAHADRSGAPAAVYGRPVQLPMSDQEQGYLRDFFVQAAGQGAHALLTVRPEVPLEKVDNARAAVLAAQVADVAEGFQGTLLVRFAPQMNAPWVPWGQQPEAYRDAFRAVAAAMDEELADPAMVWSPTAGGDYPFRAASSPPPSGGDLGALDTDGSGVWDQDDDAYSPYYPGDDVVDWVGLSAYHDETGDGPVRNTVAAPGAFEAQLGLARGTGPPSDEDFYGAYAVARDKPLMVETAAFYSPGAEGASEREIKSGWWDQVLTVASGEDYDRIAAVVWNEAVEQRGEGAATVDWRITADPELAASAGDRLKSAPVVTGPVTERSVLQGGSAAAGTVLQGPAAWVSAAVVLTAVVLLCLLFSRRLVTGWAYTDPSPRDARIDMLRGVAIVFVVINHVGLTSLFQLLTQEAVGVVSGAELFVLLSGAVLGLVYGPRARDELGEVLDRTTARARKLYVTALVVVVLVYALSRLPFLDATSVTTFTDQGTGAAGAGAAGAVYDLYAGMEGLIAYPVSAHAIPAVFLLQIGPWQFNIMGLYVILLLLSPLMLSALARGRAWLVLAISLGLYALSIITRFRLLPAQFEDSFPLLVWQVLFVLGMVAGYYRQQVVAWFAAPSRRVLLVACLVLAAALALFSWSSPYLANAYDLRLTLLPEASFRAVYDRFFGRTYLGVGRLLNVVLVVIAGYTLLSVCWRPLHRALGWFLIPLGRATLYVFILHVFLVLAVANVPALQQGNLWLNTAAYVVVLGLLWVMVRTRFLFGIIPR